MGELWAWLVLERDGSEGIVAAVLPGVGTVPLVVATGRVAELMRPYAEVHARVSGRPVRLVRFSEVETVERMP